MEFVNPEDNLGAKATGGTPVTRRITPGGVNALNRLKPAGKKQVPALMFPLDKRDTIKSKISFQIIEVIPPGKKALDQLVNVAKSVVKKEEVYYENDGTASTSNTAAQTSIDDLIKYNMVPDKKVDLYMPIAFQVNDMLSYEVGSLGLTGGALVGLAENAGSIGNQIKQEIANKGRSSWDTISTIATGGQTSDVVRASIQRMVNTIAPQTVQRATSTILQTTPNPNNRALFTGVGNREFTFQFKLVPTSAAESIQIKEIIKFFRTYAYPEGIQLAGIPFAYKFPHMFKIKLKYAEKLLEPRIKMCYLRNISTTYNPTQSSYFANGEPVETDLVLSFVEYIPLVRQDIAGSTDASNSGVGAYWDNGGGF